MNYKARKHLVFMVVFAMILSMNAGAYAGVFDSSGESQLLVDPVDRNRLPKTSDGAIGVEEGKQAEQEDEEQEEVGKNPDGLREPELIDAPHIEKSREVSLVKIEKKAIPSMMRSFSIDENLGNSINTELQTSGELDIDKVATVNPETTNQWEINLTLTGQDISTADVVLVLDRSGSMRGTSMESAKSAAKAFVNRMLDNPDKANVNIAVVSFASDVSLDSGFEGVTGKEDLITAIDGIEADGGTFMQAGIKQARALLSVSEADSKSIVLLGDGAATYSYKIDDPDDYATQEFNPRDYGFNDDRDKDYQTTSDVTENDFDYDNTVGDGTASHTRYYNSNSVDRYYRHGASAIAEAGFAKSDDYEIYTVALNTDDEGEWTLEGIASSGNDYTASDSDLEQIFQNIAGSVSYSATNATIIDPMGPMFSIPGINEDNYKSKISVNRGSISWDNDTETITWELDKISASEDNPDTMTYIVEIDENAVSNEIYPTNGDTYVYYTNSSNEPVSDMFPKPKVAIEKEEVNYAVTFVAGANGSLTGTQEFADILAGTAWGTAVTLPTPVPADGYKFKDWTPEFPTTVTENATYTAEFAAIEYTVTYAAGTGGSIEGTTPQTVSYKGNTEEVTATPAAGYKFVKWNDESKNATRSESNVTENATYTAEFAAIEYTVTYAAGTGGSIEGTTPQTVSYKGNTEEVTAIAAEGYHFVGWSDESTLVARSESNVTANATYTATFEKDEFKVEYIAGENGSIEGTTPQTVSYNGSTTEVTATPDEGYHFVGWSDENTVATRSETNVKANATYTANFGKDQFTVTFLDYNESTLKSEQVAYGEDATPPEDPEREGYTFAGWDGKYTSVTKNETVIATYTSNQFPTINYIAGIGGAVTNANEKIEEILEVALGSKAIANTGYTFQNWTRDGVIVSTNENFIPVRVDGIYEAATYKANFAKNVYTVTFLDYNESTLKSEQVAYGEDATPPAEPEREGYTFAGWNGEYTNVIQNTTIIATYTSSEEELNVTINYIAGTGGTVTNTIEIIEGISEVAKGSIATANTGYTFKNWTKNGVVVSTSANFIPVAVEGVYEAATYTANFTAITSGGGGGGSGGGSGGSSETIDEEIPETLPELNREDHFQYIQGYPDNTVRPEGKVTREEVAAVFYRLLANDYRETIKTSAQGFNDVNESRWSAKHIATLANGKIVDGYLDGSFKPGKYITRAELATIASRFDNLSPFESNSFSDVEGHWANEYINSAAQKGWLNGYPDGTFKPNQEITRAEFVTLVNNVLERRVQKENILENSKVFPDLGEDKWYYEAMEEAINSHFYTRLEDSFEKWEEIYFPEIDM